VDPERADFLRSLDSDVPTGFGAWEYARACSITHGAFHCFPRARTEWLDPCKRGELAHALAPDLDEPAAAQWKRQRDEPLAQATRKIVRRVLDRSGRRVEAVPIFPYRELPALLRRQRERDGPKPPLDLLANRYLNVAELREYREFAKTLPPLIADYDAAADELEVAIEAVPFEPRGEARRVRELADAMLALHWLRTSAFHLAQLEEVTAHPEAVLLSPKEGVTYQLVGKACVRMSELLRAYDGSSVDPDTDTMMSALRPDASAYQRLRDCRLILNPIDPLFRAQRYPRFAMQRLSQPARDRVLRIVRHATKLHERLAQTPWDWMVYYDELQTFLFVLGESTPPPNPSPGEPNPTKMPPIDFTPRPPPVDTTPDPLGPSTSGD
jgi:hypothetical protein